MSVKAIERDIYATFADIAASLGYSEIHGRVLAALLVAGRPRSLSELSREISVSVSSISLAGDLLEFLGMIRKVKRPGDRNLYIELSGDLLTGLKRAFLARIQKSINSTLTRFAVHRSRLLRSRDPEAARVLRMLSKLEQEARRLERYVNALNKLKP
jgi:DNA-binding transcriptional regulator GbsR (MarR family)